MSRSMFTGFLFKTLKGKNGWSNLSINKIDIDLVLNVYNHEEIVSFCNSNLFNHVPIVTTLTVTEHITIKDFQNIADNVKYTLPNGNECDGEGIVVRPKIPFKSKVLGKNCSFKVIDRKYKD